VKRRTLLASAMAGAVLPRRLWAQGTPKIARIGWVTAQQASSLTPYVEAFRAGLADLGYIEGRNLVLVFRYGDDHLERVPKLVWELGQIPVDLIVSQGDADVLIDKLDTSVPVVYVFSGDPVLAGFADSLARPHPNMTGLTFMAPELTAKRLDLLREMMPNLRESYRRLAYYVDRILNGAKAADLPIEQPTKFEFVLNLKSAKKLGMNVPQTLLVLADDVIE
jgi:putative tryptophan/tyrosine transport system substrate-binding protein